MTGPDAPLRQARNVFCALALLTALQGCATGVALIAPGQSPQSLPPGSPLLPHGEIDYHVAPLDTLQIEVYPSQGRADRIDYGSLVRVDVGFAGQAYAIAPGDTLSIEINADTDSVMQSTVRPDGLITLPHLSKDIRAAGRSPADLSADITAQYAAIMKTPQVTVAVVSGSADFPTKVSGTYQVGLDGRLIVPELGSFPAVGKTPDAVAGQISAAARVQFRNPVRVSAALQQLTGRDTDPRVDPNGRTYFRGAAKVSPDGAVYIQPGGLLPVAGLTLSEVRSAALALVQPLYANRIEVNVAVTEAGSLSVFVGGEVRQPGRYAYSKSMTLLQLITMSGWVTDNGDLDRVLLLHPSAPAHYTVYQSNLKEVLYHGATDQDLSVGPQDIVVIPMTYIGQVDQAIDQYIRKVLPFNTAATYSYISNPVGSNVVGNSTSVTKAP